MLSALGIAEQVFRSLEGTASARDLINAGIHSSKITVLCRNGQISRIRRGMYEWLGGERKSDVASLARLLPDAVLCMDTALDHYGFTDRTPMLWHLAVDKDRNKKRLGLVYPRIKPYFIEPRFLYMGSTTAIIEGVTIRIYNRERTICDVIRYSTKMDREIVNKAIQSYVRGTGQDIRALMEYARAFRVHRKVDAMIGVWL